MLAFPVVPRVALHVVLQGTLRNVKGVRFTTCSIGIGSGFRVVNGMKRGLYQGFRVKGVAL